MALKSLGLVTVAASGTPVRATSNESVPATRVGCQAIQIEAAPGNAGLIYIGTSDMVISTGVGVLAVLPKPTSATTGPFPSQSYSIPEAPAGINAADVYIDASNSSDKAYISITVQ
jgi:hypothetical protein